MATRSLKDAAPLKFIEPLMPTLVEVPPAGPDWLHEIKYDGYRTQLIIQHASVRAFTRNGHDWTEKYWPIVEQAASLACFSAIIEGELIVQDSEGRSDFHGLRGAISERPQDLVLMCFDLLHFNGRERRLPSCRSAGTLGSFLRKLRLFSRKRHLRDMASIAALRRQATTCS